MITDFILEHFCDTQKMSPVGQLLGAIVQLPTVKLLGHVPHAFPEVYAYAGEVICGISFTKFVVNIRPVLNAIALSVFCTSCIVQQVGKTFDIFVECGI